MTDTLPGADVPGVGVTTRRSRLGGEREVAILRAAYDLLAETGYEGLRLDAVAARAKASKATLYRHWSGKAQLVVEAVKCCKGSPMEPVDTGSLRGDLSAVMSEFAEAIAGEDGPLLAALLMAIRTDEELAREFRQQYETKRELGEQVCGRAVERGELPAMPDPDLLDEIASPMLFMRSVVFGEQLDEAFLAHIVDDILIPALRSSADRSSADR